MGKFFRCNAFFSLFKINRDSKFKMGEKTVKLMATLPEECRQDIYKEMILCNEFYATGKF